MYITNKMRSRVGHCKTSARMSESERSTGPQKRAWQARRLSGHSLGPFPDLRSSHKNGLDPKMTGTLYTYLYLSIYLSVYLAIYLAIYLSI